MKQLVVRSWYSDKRLYVINKKKKKKTNMNILLLLDLTIVLNSSIYIYFFKFLNTIDATIIMLLLNTKNFI